MDVRSFPWRRVGVVGLLAVAAVSIISAARDSGWNFPDWGQVTWLRPERLLAAVLFQIGNGLSDVLLWRAVFFDAGISFTWRALWRLSFSVQAVNQLVPSAGISGSVALIRGLEQQGAPRPVAVTAVLLTTASFYISFALFLGLAVSPVYAGGAALLMPVLAWLARARWGAMDAALLRKPRLWLWGMSAQALAWLSDLATLAALVTAFETEVSGQTLVAALAAGTLAKSAVPVLQGLGVAEAAMAACFIQFGVAPVHAVATAILYRVVRFWLPLIPGAYGLFSARDRLAGKSLSAPIEASDP